MKYTRCFIPSPLSFSLLFKNAILIKNTNNWYLSFPFSSLSFYRHFSVAIDKYLVELQTLDPSTPDINTLTAGLRNLKRELQRNLDTIK